MPLELLRGQPTQFDHVACNVDTTAVHDHRTELLQPVPAIAAFFPAFEGHRRASTPAIQHGYPTLNLERV